MGGHGLGGICVHINHFGYHIKEIWILKAWGGGRYAERAWGEHGRVQVVPQIPVDPSTVQLPFSRLPLPVKA